MANVWTEYAEKVVAAAEAEAVIQRKLRPILLRAKGLARNEDDAPQVAALLRAAEPLQAQLAALPVRVGRLLGLACARHLSDLATGHERGLTFNATRAGAAVAFYSYLTHNKGEWAGTPLTLEPWQQFIIASLFGWKRADGTRRFREAYIEVARKNGKSTVLSGVGLQLLTADGEQGAEVYCAATKKEQARIVFGDAQNMARKSAALGKILRVQQHSIFVPATMSKMVPMSSDSKTEDGLNPHGINIDEYHAHPTDSLYSVLKSATGARSQPLLTIITTAGFNRLGPCAQLRKSCVGILEKLYTDDAYFAVIFTLDDGDDWADEAVWTKANPNLGVSISLEYLREQFRTASRLPSQQVNFKTKHLNLWTDSSTVWLPRELWDQGSGGTAVAELAGRKCWGGLDLASIRDITALVLLFSKENDEFDALCWFWVPEEAIAERSKADGVPYQQWVDEGYMIATPGNVTDYNYLKAEIKRLCDLYQVHIINYDRFNASQLVIDLTEEGVNMKPFGQGFVDMSTPTKGLERLVAVGKIHHYDNPVLAWMCGNVEIRQDEANNIKIDKKRSKEKVDGMVALVQALDGFMKEKKGEDFIYNTKDLLVLGRG